MSLFGRFVLALVGLGAFLLIWQGIVIATTPPPVRRVTLAFAEAAEGKAFALIVSSKGETLVEGSFNLDEASRADGVMQLRTWLGSHQPTQIAMPNAPNPALTALVDRAKHEYGGGMPIEEVGVDRVPDTQSQARRRAELLQQETAKPQDWIPRPPEAFAALWEMTKSGEMVRHIVASVFRVASGFLIAAALAIPFGLALGSFAWVNALTNSLIQFLRPISPIAWLPVATLIFGGGDQAAIYLIFLCAFFPIAVSTAAAVATVDLKYRRSALNFGVEGLAAARYVILPAAMPSILTALRIAVGISWVVVVAAEMLGVESGLGYLVLDARNQLRFDKVVAAMIVIGAIGLGIDWSMRRFERVELERRGLGAR